MVNHFKNFSFIGLKNEKEILYLKLSFLAWRGLWLALRVWMGWGRCVGGRAWTWRLNLAQLMRLGAALRASSVLFARVGPVGVCVRARVGVARRWSSASSHRFSRKAVSLI